MSLTLLGLSALVGCASADGVDTGAPDSGADGPHQDGGTGGALDGGTAGTSGIRMWAPDVCQGELIALGEAPFEVREPPLVYKGDFFGFTTRPTDEGPRFALVSLVDDTTLALDGQSAPGLAQDEVLWMGQSGRFAVAPDLGDDNDVAFPVILSGMTQQGPVPRVVVYRSDGAGALEPALLGGEPVSIGRPEAFPLPLEGASGEVERVGDLTLGASDELVFRLTQTDGARFLVHQGSGSGPLRVLLAAGDPLATGDEAVRRIVHDFGTPRIGFFGEVRVRIEIETDSMEVEGFADLSIDPLTGNYQCQATNTSILCGGALIPTGHEVAASETDGDGGTYGVVSIAPDGTQTLQYKVIGQPQVQTAVSGSTFGGVQVWRFGPTRVCSRENALFVVVQRFGEPDVLLRVDEDGTIRRLTDFEQLWARGDLDGELPDEIRALAVSHRCDAVLSAWGPSGPDRREGYEGYWAVTRDGQVFELMEETAGRPTGDLAPERVGRARTGLDPLADPDAPARLGPDGELYFAVNRRGGGGVSAVYAVARAPRDGCDGR